MRRRVIPRPSPQMLALENALDQIPDPASMTPDENRLALAVLNKASETTTRRVVAVLVRSWMDEQSDALPGYGTKKAS